VDQLTSHLSHNFTRNLYLDILITPLCPFFILTCDMIDLSTHHIQSSSRTDF